jgi:NAD(P)-dependent dehydrogenase (short-subunit alcohol dehydrogenase family)
MASYLITGASRGLGLELTRQLSSFPASEVGKVFATTRGDAPELDDLVEKSSGRVVAVRLDVTNEATIKQAAAEVEANLNGKGLDVLINNAGIAKWFPEGLDTM